MENPQSKLLYCALSKGVFSFVFPFPPSHPLASPLYLSYNFTTFQLQSRSTLKLIEMHHQIFVSFNFISRKNNNILFEIHCWILLCWTQFLFNRCTYLRQQSSNAFDGNCYNFKKNSNQKPIFFVTKFLRILFKR